MTENEEEILSRLLLDEEETLRRLHHVVDLAERLFGLDPKSRTIVISDAAKKTTTVKEMIVIFLIARYFGANRIKVGEEPFFDTETATVKDVADFLRKKTTAVSGRLTDLMREGIIGKDDLSRYYIYHHKVETELSSLNSGLED